MMDFELAWDSRCTIGESPVWDERNRRILFCDIPGKRIHALGLETGARETFDFPEIVCSLGVCRSGRLVVAPFRWRQLETKSSLRAKRSNPENREVKTGLLRRFAPRNDESMSHRT